MIVICISIALISAVIVAILPAFIFRLDFQSTYKLWTNQRYRLSCFIHKRYKNVREEMQPYELFYQEILSIYNDDLVSAKYSPFKRNVLKNDIRVISEMLSNEDFTRKYYAPAIFPFSTYSAMVKEWNMMSKERRNPKGNKYNTLDGMTITSFEGLLTDKAPCETIEILEQYFSLKRSGLEIALTQHALSNMKIITPIAHSTYAKLVKQRFQLAVGESAIRNNWSRINQDDLDDESAEIVETIQFLFKARKCHC